MEIANYLARPSSTLVAPGGPPDATGRRPVLSGAADGLVSTTFISQGGLAGILRGEFFQRHHPGIHFAHCTFAWTSEARSGDVGACRGDSRW